MSREAPVRIREGLGVKLPRATRLVICCRPGKAGEAMQAMRGMMEKLRLTVNEKKTRQCLLPQDTFRFLGFTFGKQVSWKTGRPYLTPYPAATKVLKICETISEETSSRTTWRTETDQVQRLNQILAGWGNYFRLGYVTGAWQIVQQHACRRLRRWFRRKHKQRGGVQGYPDMQLYEKYGLLNLRRAIRRISLWA
jgi:RNA-directed DNA polymerase